MKERKECGKKLMIPFLSSLVCLISIGILKGIYFWILIGILNSIIYFLRLTCTEEYRSLNILRRFYNSFLVIFLGPLGLHYIFNIGLIERRKSERKKSKKQY